MKKEEEDGILSFGVCWVSKMEERLGFLYKKDEEGFDFEKI
jgi:hypothetical protein